MKLLNMPTTLCAFSLSVYPHTPSVIPKPRDTSHSVLSFHVSPVCLPLHTLITSYRALALCLENCSCGIFHTGLLSLPLNHLQASFCSYNLAHYTSHKIQNSTVLSVLCEIAICLGQARQISATPHIKCVTTLMMGWCFHPHCNKGSNASLLFSQYLGRAQHPGP